VCGAAGKRQGRGIKGVLLDQIRARATGQSFYDPRRGVRAGVLTVHGRECLAQSARREKPAVGGFGGKFREAYTTQALPVHHPDNEKLNVIRSG